MKSHKLYFSKRISEPKQMDKLEQDVFEKASLDNYKRWMIPLVDDALGDGFKAGTILDIACGPGLLINELAIRNKKSKIIGIDISSYVLKLARKNCLDLSNVFFKKATVYKLPFPKDTFDLVVCKDSLHHFDNISLALNEMYRVTKKGGKIYLQDLRRDLPWYLLKMVIPPKSDFQKLLYYSARAAYTKREIKNTLKKIGIKSCKIKTRHITKKLKQQYKMLRVDLGKLREGFQARYVVVINKI